MTQVRALIYNILQDDLSSNYVPRTMDELDEALLTEVFGDGAKDKWAAVVKDLGAEYMKWHPQKTMLTDPAGRRLKARGLWGQGDLTKLAGLGWQLENTEPVNATTLRVPDPKGGPAVELTTFLGVVLRHLDAEKGKILYENIKKVEQLARVWEVRGPRILKRIIDIQATFVILCEYDVNILPTDGCATFREAMAKHGYDGYGFKGPGQEVAGVGVFWKRDEVRLPPGSQEFPADGFISATTITENWGNIDLEEPGIDRPMDRRMLAFVRLLTKDDRPVLVCGAHMMTVSRDKTGVVRANELAKIRTLIAQQATADDAVVFGGDFNINSRGRKDEGIWHGGEKKELIGFREEAGPPTVRRFDWERKGGDQGSLVMRDAYGDVVYSDDSCTTRTGTRLETIDYILYDEAKLTPIEGTRSPLQCTAEQMPNLVEPSDHVPLAISFSLK